MLAAWDVNAEIKKVVRQQEKDRPWEQGKNVDG